MSILCSFSSFFIKSRTKSNKQFKRYYGYCQRRAINHLTSIKVKEVSFKNIFQNIFINIYLLSYTYFALSWFSLHYLQFQTNHQAQPYDPVCIHSGSSLSTYTKFYPNSFSCKTNILLEIPKNKWHPAFSFPQSKRCSAMQTRYLTILL